MEGMAFTANSVPNSAFSSPQAQHNSTMQTGKLFSNAYKQDV